MAEAPRPVIDAGPGRGSLTLRGPCRLPARDGNSVQEAADVLLTTGEMARRSNSTLRTVRFYEEEGILPARRGAPRAGTGSFSGASSTG